ncbi:acyl-CoA N-acyltransferase [Favolaschia claudopus]|uniref:Acyl-CoA N-acyltransferase n=1 Tax=Favolaschia claudopus TaxID=2862362 RepID=A0AAW0CKH1_9AGAR
MSSDATFLLVPAHTPEHLPLVRSLFTSYTTWLDLDLTFQNYAAELADLPGAYSPPSGAILLAIDAETSTPLGIIAMRPLKSRAGNADSSERCCELKRLYTLPEARGRGVARALVREALNVAREAGYQKAMLDTLEKMEAARKLYASEGFEETEKYYETPLVDTMFMVKKLNA